MTRETGIDVAFAKLSEFWETSHVRTVRLASSGRLELIDGEGRVVEVAVVARRRPPTASGRCSFRPPRGVLPPPALIAAVNVDCMKALFYPWSDTDRNLGDADFRAPDAEDRSLIASAQAIGASLRLSAEEVRIAAGALTFDEIAARRERALAGVRSGRGRARTTGDAWPADAQRRAAGAPPLKLGLAETLRNPRLKKYRRPAS